VAVKNQRALAFHEAGHAVAAVAFGCRLDHVSALAGRAPDGSTWGGNVAYRQPPVPPDLPADLRRAVAEQRLMQGAVIALAGPAAQRRAAPRSRVPAVGTVDRAEAERLASIVARDAKCERALLTYAANEARALVENEWSVIEALADSLLKAEYLPGDRATRIIREAEADREAAFREANRLHVVPSDDDLDAYSAEQHRRTRTVQRRDVAEGVLQSVLTQLAIGDQDPLNSAEINAAVRDHAERRDLDADAASRKLHSMIDQKRTASTWRPFVPRMVAIR
jgi:hypothetical protein